MAPKPLYARSNMTIIPRCRRQHHFTLQVRIGKTHRDDARGQRACFGDEVYQLLASCTRKTKANSRGRSSPDNSSNSLRLTARDTIFVSEIGGWLEDAVAFVPTDHAWCLQDLGRRLHDLRLLF